MTFTIQTGDLYNTYVRLPTFFVSKTLYDIKTILQTPADIIYAIRIHY